MEKLTGMRLLGMVKALRQWLEKPRDKVLTPTDLVGMLADAESIHRENQKLTLRLRHAKLKQQAYIEDINYNHARGLSKTAVLDLASSRWAANHRNVIITGPTGVGKSFLACALGQKACRDGYTVVYRRASRLFDELAQARADGTYPLLLRRIAKTQVLILDDFGLEILGAPQRKDLNEILDDRYNISSTIVTSQLEPNDWHGIIGDETLADAICDRMVHNAHKLKLAGESIRKVVSRIVDGKPKRPSEFDPSIPPALEAVCLMALHTNPEDRFPSLQEFIHAIETIGGATQLSSRETVGAYVSELFPAEKDPRRQTLRRPRQADPSIPSGPPAGLARPVAEPKADRQKLRWPALAAIVLVTAVLAAGIATWIQRPALSPGERLAAAEKTTGARARTKVLVPLITRSTTTEAQLVKAGELLLNVAAYDDALKLADNLQARFPNNPNGALFEARAAMRLRLGKRSEAAIAIGALASS